MSTSFPYYAHEFTPELLTEVMSRTKPGLKVTEVAVVEGKQYGDGNASTAGRCIFDLKYAPGSDTDLPSRIVVKIARVGAGDDHRVLYRNELNFYDRVRPELSLETPRIFGSHYDEESGTFALIMEDLRLRGGEFMHNQIEHSPDHVRQLLDVLAVLHAKYWESPRFASDLAWVPSQTRGEMHMIFTNPERVPAYIAATTAKWHFKKEMLQRMGVTLDELYHQFQRAQQNQARGPLTLLHGDTHVGNTYRVPGGAGLIDWQLFCHGHYMHDVGYYLQTSLAVGVRREHEQDLLRYYLGRLKEEGVASPPSFDEAWLDYRRTCPWNVYVGWLTADIDNYGWEICELAHLRVMTAYEDLESAKAMAALG
jgi:hypothetical protein